MYKTWINSTFSLSTRDSHSTQFILDWTSNNIHTECITVFIVFIHNCLPCQDCYILNKIKLQKPKNFSKLFNKKVLWCTLTLVNGPGVSNVTMTCMVWQYNSHSNSHSSQHYVYMSSKYVISDNWTVSYNGTMTDKVTFSKQNLNLLP